MEQPASWPAKPRQRSSVACNPCRAKRRKCDGKRPSCSACLQVGHPCEFTTAESNRKPPSKRHVEALQARIRLLEREVDHYRGEQSSSHPRPSNDYENGDDDIASADERSPMKDLTDRLGTLNVGEDGHMRYFGPRSNFSFLRSRLSENSSVSAVEVQNRATKTLDRLNLNVHVDMELRDHLLDLFWRWQNSWQYLVVKDVFLRHLDSDPTASGSHASPLLLSAMLALSARYSDRPELRTDPSNPNTAGDALADKAKMLLLYESEAPTITTVQAAALLSLRETATEKESLGWVYCGMATRMAYNLGLHLDWRRWAASGHITQEEGQIRSIVWWGCYVLDKLFNIGLGRPSTVREVEITAPMPFVSDEQGGADESSEQPTLRSITSNSVAFCKLLEDVTGALDQVYLPRTNEPRWRILDLVSRTQVRLMEFYTQLSSSLRLPPSFSQAAQPHIYQLHLQYHVLVILLHRPFIGVRSGGSSIGRIATLENAHFRECKRSALYIANIFKAYRSHYTLRRIPISAVHCALTASIIFLFEATAPEIDTVHLTTRALDVLVTALIEMATAWEWSWRALSAVHRLMTEWTVCDEVKQMIEAKTAVHAKMTERIVGRSSPLPESPPDPLVAWDTAGLSWDFSSADIFLEDQDMPMFLWDDQWDTNL